ncbi:DUF167 domain-containing protein [Sphingomonas edaphi]|uniref:UPF0235 protein D3M59_10095 n=1 Tax=Sphingomonas edaphi TaxID=2315689 RepID=A0A418PZ17_9SPHN|nr:DUF167 domain-containing protein [Sphingomonas edaphi]RIX27384.1 DUF167 domain-containing protein [Sphingomonas edaphi]
MSCVLALRVSPRAARAGIGPWRAGADGREELEVRVTAPPTDGKANAEVIELLAKRLRLTKSSVRIVAGETSRHKRVALPLDEEAVRSLLG